MARRLNIYRGTPAPGQLMLAFLETDATIPGDHIDVIINGEHDDTVTLHPNLVAMMEQLDANLDGLTGEARRRTAASVFFDDDTGELRCRNLTLVPTN